MPGWTTTLLRSLTDLVWPRTCAVCDAAFDPNEPSPCLCSACRTALCDDPFAACPRCSGTVGPHTDLSNGCPSCRTATLHFGRAVRLGPYDGPLRTAILRMKHEAGEPLAEELGRLLGEARREQLVSDNPELVVPVPLHWRRRWSRGFNQSGSVARELARALGRAVRSDCLIRIRPTRHQPTLSATERWENVRDAFRVRREASVRGVRILLVDDVMTTGATADSAATALLKAGAAQVTVAVLARR